MEHFDFCEKKDPLAESIDIMLPGVKQCFKSQNFVINDNECSIKKVDVNISELLKLTQLQHACCHITISWEIFIKHTVNYVPYSSNMNSDVLEEVNMKFLCKIIYLMSSVHIYVLDTLPKYYRYITVCIMFG